MANTRGKLVAAKIFESDDKGKDLKTNTIECMFNPFEYTVTKSNSYSKKAKNRSKTPQFEFKESGAQSLKLSLTFDTYNDKKDVSRTTSEMWKFMEPKKEGDDKKKKEPPTVTFEWGVFRFVAVITNMTQKFTLFLKDGTPVRAKVDVTFTQHIDVDDYTYQNPTSGDGAIERIWSITRGDRLDSIAAEVYGDSTKWRLIAEHNGIINPLRLQPGRKLSIPQELL